MSDLHHSDGKFRHVVGPKSTKEKRMSYERDIVDDYDYKAALHRLLNAPPAQMSSSLGLLPINSEGMRTLVDALAEAQREIERMREVAKVATQESRAAFEECGHAEAQVRALRAEVEALQGSLRATNAVNSESERRLREMVDHYIALVESGALTTPPPFEDRRVAYCRCGSGKPCLITAHAGAEE